MCEHKRCPFFLPGFHPASPVVSCPGSLNDTGEGGVGARRIEEVSWHYMGMALKTGIYRRSSKRLQNVSPLCLSYTARPHTAARIQSAAGMCGNVLKKIKIK